VAPVSMSRSSPLTDSRIAPRITPDRVLYNLTVAWYLRALSSFEPVARIDLSALADNLGEVRRLVGPRVRVLAMVKADAYGHGAAAVTERLASHGVDTFGVATLEEAERLAPVRGASAVVVFGGISPDEAARAIALDVEVVTDSRDLVSALGARAAAVGRDARVHIEVETGMRRLGLAPAEAVELARFASATRGVTPVAVCSHFAMAESVSTEVTDGQLERLTTVAEALASEGIRLRRHLANSAAVMSRPAAHLDMVRPGLMLYGLYPAESFRSVAELRAVMTLEACVVRVAEVGPGEGIGYGHTFRASRRMLVATLRCGYADGYPRVLSNRGGVSFDGTVAPIVGRVCMDHLMVDVTGVPGVRRGSRGTLWGQAPATESVADQAGTISYELVSRVSPRVRREVIG
jgi:alanine racemase